MKIIICIIGLLSFNINAQTICKKDVSENYIFQYEIKNNSMSYKVTSKNNEPITFFYIKKYDYSNNIGFKIENYNNENNLGHDLDSFFKEYDTFYSINMDRGMLPYSIGHMDDSLYFKTQNKISENIDINKFIKLFKSRLSEDSRYGIKKIQFKIKLILDKNFNNCAQFSTEYFRYDLGSKFNQQFNEKFNQLFILWRG